ncbi:ATP-dependent RNA helicase ROK1 [Purpureocillium lavendulum]|uniref:ATP-dependent RNA helicase ROK1 n=1 Tax=Purpureocillium lavendulum TaxID=1247861 RepID=A0AB34FY85_9HYPO|nr:ATP-dependent RNA helicase ROK1 [Purpureocillium lavendulum]
MTRGGHDPETPRSVVIDEIPPESRIVYGPPEVSELSALISRLGPETRQNRRSARLNAMLESGNVRNSYASLDSEPDDDGLMPSARRNLGPAAPGTPAAARAGHALGYGASHELTSGITIGAGNDSFYDNIARLPFPLVSLPEAAKMQRYRIDRGEEDHTDPPSSFAAKARSTRSGTFSSMSSRNSPLTPLSPFGDMRGSALTSTPARPPTAYQDAFSRRKDTPSFGTSQSRLHSSAILGGSPITPMPRRTSGGPWHEVGLRDSPSILGLDFRRLRGFSLRTRQRRAGTVGQSFEMFSRSEAELIRSAREEVLLHRSMRGQEDDRLKVIFLAVMVLTLILPPIGLIALLGHFDSAISWYTHGDAHRLTREQRSILKQQLMVEGALYVGLVIGLVVYFSRHA